MSDRDFLNELQRRKDNDESPCDSCDGKGGRADSVCADCLGQGYLLTEDEYRTLLRMAGIPQGVPVDVDSILDQQEFEYKTP